MDGQGGEAQVKSEFDLKDEIDVLDEHNALRARVRVRDAFAKASIYLTPDQLVEHGLACIALAHKMRDRR